MAAAQSLRCLSYGCYPVQVARGDSFENGYRFGQALRMAVSRPNHRRGFHAAVIGGMLLAGCGSIKCDLIGSDSLRQQCEGNEIIVPVWSWPTWYPGQELRDLWTADKAAQERERAAP